MIKKNKERERKKEVICDGKIKGVSDSKRLKS